MNTEQLIFNLCILAVLFAIIWAWYSDGPDPAYVPIVHSYVAQPVQTCPHDCKG